MQNPGKAAHPRVGRKRREAKYPKFCGCPQKLEEMPLCGYTWGQGVTWELRDQTRELRHQSRSLNGSTAPWKARVEHKSHGKVRTWHGQLWGIQLAGPAIIYQHFPLPRAHTQHRAPDSQGDGGHQQFRIFVSLRQFILSSQLLQAFRDQENTGFREKNRMQGK